MKLQRLQKSKFPNLDLQLVKQYRKKKNFNLKTDIKETEILLDKIAHIVYLYHVTGKTILFLGFPENFNKILKTTKHLLVPEFMWHTNMFSNNVNISNNHRKAKIPKNIFKLKTKLRKKVDLLVMNNADKNEMAFKESYLARIPVILLTKDLNINQLRYTYSATGSYQFFAEKEETQSFFVLFIKSVLLRAKKCNKKLINSSVSLHNKTNVRVKSYN